MYRTDFWTLWEKVRVGCFKRTASKHVYYLGWNITSPGWMHETSAQAWCTGNTQRNPVERVVGGGIGWGIHVTPWLIHVNVWQNPLKYCKVIHLQLIKINEKKEKKIKLDIQNMKIMISSPNISLQIDGEKLEIVTEIIFLGSKITADGDCSHEIKTLAPLKKSYDQPKQHIKKQTLLCQQKS